MVTFDTTRNQVVKMKVGISFVSVANARANLARRTAAGASTRSPRAATGTWDTMLGRIAVTGGTAAEQQTFYSALYHSLLHPNVFSDDNGEYPGFDGKVHTARRLHAVRELLGLGHLPLGDAAARARRARTRPAT